VTARPHGGSAGTAGLTAFVVPRSLPDGAPNGFTIRRLKDKLGTRSMASAEVDFVGALALPVADFRLTLDLVLNTSRLYNAVVAAGVLQRAWREAAAYAAERRAFGSRLLDLPTIARVVANLRTEAHAARGLSFALAEAADRAAVGRAEPGEPEARRFLVNCNKIWTATTCPAGVRSAIEVFGGNGAIEAFSVLPRLLRDAIVLEAWEGGHGVLCAQLLRDAQRLGLHRPAFAWLRRQPGADLAALDEQQSRFERVIVRPDAEAHIRDAIESLRPVAQAACLDPARDPVEAAARRHLLVTNARGWDPLEDPDLSARVATLVG
jgi:alkylation response protein AidB-like acyl-CoA dehydrogenase